MTTLAELKAEHDALAKKIAAFEAKEEWPEFGDKYFYLLANGVYSSTWGGDPVDKGYTEQGLVFRTEKEAEKHRQRNIVMKKLRDLAGGFVPDWDDTAQTKYVIFFNYRYNNWDTSGYDYTYHYGQAYFHTRQEAQHAIDTLGDELKVLV